MKKLVLGFAVSILFIIVLVPIAVFGSESYATTMSAGMYSDLIFDGDGVVNITGGTFYNITFKEDVVANISGGIFINSDFFNKQTNITGGYFINAEAHSGELNINNGTFNYLTIHNEVDYNILPTIPNPKDRFKNSTVFSMAKSPTELSFYNTLDKAMKNIPTNRYPTNVVMYGDYEDDIFIAGNQNAILDLNGYTLGKDDNSTYIDIHGSLVILDETNELITDSDDPNNNAKDVVIGNGTVHSKICKVGTLSIKTGQFTTDRVFINKEQAVLNNSTEGWNLTDFIFVSPNEEMEQSSYYYVKNKALPINGSNPYYILKTGNLDYELTCEVYDSKGNLVKSTDSDIIQDVSLGEKYITKIYIKSNSIYNVKLNGFEITAAYQFVDKKYSYDKMVVETPYVDDNRYYVVDYYSTDRADVNEADKDKTLDGIGLMSYSLDNANYYIPAALNTDLTQKENYKGLQIAQYNFVVDGDVDTSSSIKFGFAGFGDFKDITPKSPQTVDVMKSSTAAGNNLLPKMPIKDCKGQIVNTKNKYDGITIADYKYVPEGYKLAIVTVEHKDDEILKFGDTPMYYTSNEKFIAESQNPLGMKAVYFYKTEEEISKLSDTEKENLKLGRVYLKLVKVEDLVKEGLMYEADIENYSVIIEAIQKKLTISKIADYKAELIEKYKSEVNKPDLKEEDCRFIDADNCIFDKFDNYIKSFEITYIGSTEYTIDNKKVLKINPYDLDRDGMVDYNDASMAYRMLLKDGNIWSYDLSSIGNYLGERGRLFAAAKEGNAIFYGTILDVVNIINSYNRI